MSIHTVDMIAKVADANRAQQAQLRPIKDTEHYCNLLLYHAQHSDSLFHAAMELARLCAFAVHLRSLHYGLVCMK